jgi:hypothetical protein
MRAFDLGAERDLECGYNDSRGIAGLGWLDTGLDPAIGHPGRSESEQQCNCKHGKYSAFNHDGLLMQWRMVVIDA